MRASADLDGALPKPPLVFVVEIFGLTGGLAMVLGHNVWSAGLAFVVTLIGWVTFH
jgi:hypothetical protein